MVILLGLLYHYSVCLHVLSHSWQNYTYGNLLNEFNLIVLQQIASNEVSILIEPPSIFPSLRYRQEQVIYEALKISHTFTMVCKHVYNVLVAVQNHWE